VTSVRIERTTCDACGAVAEWKPDAKESLSAAWHDVDVRIHAKGAAKVARCHDACSAKCAAAILTRIAAELKASP
jgi:hypothetical protein